MARNNGFNLKLTPADHALLQTLRKEIRHVIYIVKENRTYDQLLGDLPAGNGDPNLTQFREAVTPNQHALAKEFVQLDNFYDPSNVSYEGWQWSTAARSVDATEKTYSVNYARRGLSYDSEGTDRNVNVAYPTVAARQEANPATPSDPDLLPGPRNEEDIDGPGERKQGAAHGPDARRRTTTRLRRRAKAISGMLRSAPGAAYAITVFIAMSCGIRWIPRRAAFRRSRTRSRRGRGLHSRRTKR